MKKLLVFSILLWFSLLFVWCGKQDDSQNLNVTSNSFDSVASSDVCKDNWWNLVNREDWWNVIVCWFDDDTFCFLEDLEDWNCEKWFLPFDDVEPVVDNAENDIDLSTQEWRQAHCLQWIKEQVVSNSYSVSWDWESEDNGLIISDWLLQIDDWYYDVECSHEVNGEWFNVSIMPIEEITYWE